MEYTTSLEGYTTEYIFSHINNARKKKQSTFYFSSYHESKKIAPSPNFIVDVELLLMTAMKQKHAY